MNTDKCRGMIGKKITAETLRTQRKPGDRFQVTGKIKSVCPETRNLTPET
jgi:hypothetical protein